MCCAAPASAVNIVLDYSYDATSFFGAGNPSGAAAGTQAKAAIEAVASFYSGILTDTFDAIVKPPDFPSAEFNGIAYWNWTASFTNPSSGSNVVLNNPPLSADVYRIYVGARSISGTTLGIGGPGGRGWSQTNNGGFFSFEELDQIDVITAQWEAAVETRGEASGFANWGGVVTFDTSGTLWHYNHTTAPTAGTNDFYSVAIHEMGHALGLGASDQWSALASGALFAGPAAAAEYGSPPPLNPTRGHWASGTMSRVFGTNTPQEAALDPEITTGTRKVFTSLDGAGLVDIGWSVNEPEPPTYHAADFSQDHYVNGLDLALWKMWFGPNTMANADGDADSDGNDFLRWQRAVGTVQVTPSGGGVPEPASAALLAWVAMALMRRRTIARKFRSPPLGGGVSSEHGRPEVARAQLAPHAKR
jgi:hypothetical protein